MPTLASLRNDLVGGLVSAAVAIPLAIGFGMFAFVALGDQYFADGALAGLATAFIVGVASVLLGDRTTTVYAPRITTTFFIGLLLLDLSRSDHPVLKEGGVPLLLLVLFLIVLLAGALQALFGLLKFGTLMKFAPQPVMAGFQNTAAILLFLVQIGNIMGFDRNMSFTAALSHMDAAKPLSVALAAVVFLAMWNAKRLIPKVPPLLTALLLGIVLFYALQLFGFGRELGPVIGNVSSNAPKTFPLQNFYGLLSGGKLLDLWQPVLGGAVALAIIASLDAVLCSRLVTPPGERKQDSNELLVRLGVGNMWAASFGGITSGINIGPSLVNRAFGARTIFSVLINAAVIFLAFSVLFPLLAYMPRVVLSAVIMVVAVQHIDPWSLELGKRVFARSAHGRGLLLLELLVVILVAVLAITVHVVLAVFLGIVIAIALFVIRMGRSSIRRQYRCDAVHSRKSRSPADAVILERRGGEIVVMELQGALFFGSAETLAREIETALNTETKSVVLDLRRITEIDSTGAHVLASVDADLKKRGKNLLLSVGKGGDIGLRLADLGYLETAMPDKIFPDVDRAMQWAEDDLLRGQGEQEIPVELSLDSVSVLATYGPAEIAAMQPHLVRREFAKGSTIFREGDPGNELFFVLGGSASAYLQQPNGDIRLVTFPPGSVFGELAILDSGSRSATVIADENLVVLGLAKNSFVTMAAQNPPLAIKFLASLGRELSGRLRRANRAIHQLES